MDRRYSSSPNIRFLILYQIDLYPVRNIPISLCSSAGMRRAGMKYRELGIFDHGRTKSNLNFSLFSVWFYNEISCSMILAEIEIENC